MFATGDFAMHGRVSGRVPRHDDAIGLLRAATVGRVPVLHQSLVPGHVAVNGVTCPSAGPGACRRR
jgi:hypothetical protein